LLLCKGFAFAAFAGRALAVIFQWETCLEIEIYKK